MTDPVEAPQIAPAALDRWAAFPPDAPLQLSLTKADLDNLLLGLRTLAIGQGELAAALSAHTSQDLEGCVDGLMQASALARSSFGRINAFISAVMGKAAPTA